MTQQNNDIFCVAEKLNVRRLPLWKSEAQFGFSHIKNKIDNLPKNSNILEVGCGSGLLLSMLVEKYPSHQFSGVEPLGDGFQSLKELNSIVQQSGLKIEPCGYEGHKPLRKYDLIYCINVFEHVTDWRHLLEWVATNLQNHGQFVVLCPNYGFPVESHFKLPILVNKNITYRVFSKSIHKFEVNNNVEGLWNSLNFVKKLEVKSYVEKRKVPNLEYYDDLKVIDDLITRVKFDKEFKKRQRLLGYAATFFEKIGMLGLVKLFPNFLPYMKMTFKKIK